MRAKKHSAAVMTAKEADWVATMCLFPYDGTVLARTFWCDSVPRSRAQQSVDWRVGWLKFATTCLY